MGRTTSAGRAVMAALVARQHYDPTEDSQEWAAADAGRVLGAVRAGADPLEAIVAALIDAGLHDPTSDDAMACLEGDAAAVLNALERSVVVFAAPAPSEYGPSPEQGPPGPCAPAAAVGTVRV